VKITLKQAGAGVAATAGVLASLVGVASYIDEKSKGPPPPDSKSLKIQSVTLTDRAARLGDFLTKTPNYTGRTYTPAELQLRGYAFLLSVHSEGPIGTRLRLAWKLLVDGGDPVPGADYNQVASDFKTSALKQDADVPVWIPDPTTRGRYVVRFTFDRLDSNGHVISYATEKDSAPIIFA
jgi:hypothetical protein